MRNSHIVRAWAWSTAVLLITSAAFAQDWPGWRGPHSDNKASDFKAPAAWPKELTKKWKVTVGEGESSPILQGDKVYTFGRQGGDEVILCHDAMTGKEVWKFKYESTAVKGPAAQFPGVRSTPVVGEGKVCTLGVNGLVTCVDAAKGTKVWTAKSDRPFFYTSTSPLITKGLCIVFGNGLTAYDLKDGSIKWTWGKSAQAPYGSPVIMTVDDIETVVTPSVGALVGVKLADGKELWKHNMGPGGKDYFHHYSTPLIDGSNVIYSITAGKGGGGSMIGLKIEKSKATETWNNKKAAADKYHCPVLHDGLIFGVNQGRQFYCLDAKTGEQKWVDTSKKRGSCGSILNCGSVMVALTSDSELVVFKASAKAYEEVAKYNVSTSETWAVPILVGNRIYVKDKGGSLTLWTLN